MEQRNFFNAPQASTLDHGQIWSHPYMGSHMGTGNGATHGQLWSHPHADAPSGNSVTHGQIWSHPLPDSHLGRGNTDTHGQLSSHPHPNAPLGNSVSHGQIWSRPHPASQFVTGNTVTHGQPWSFPHPDSHLGTENGVVMPRNGVTNTAMIRPNNHASSTYSNYTARPLHDPHVHHSSSARSSWSPHDQLSHALPLSSNPQSGSLPNTEIERATLKRRHPATPLAFNGGYTSGHYTAASSSNLHISSNLLPPNPMARSQYWSSDPASSTHGYRNDNLVTAGEVSQRNVRSRHDPHGVHMDVNQDVAYSSNNLPCHFHAAQNLTGLGGELNIVQMPLTCQGRNHSSGPSFNYEDNSSLTGASVVNNNTIPTNGFFHQDPNWSRNTSYIPPRHDLVTQDIGTVGSNGYIQRSDPYSIPGSSYIPMGYAIASAEGGMTLATESFASFSYSRQPPVAQHDSYRNGSLCYNRFQSGYNEDGTYSGWSYEGALVIDQSAFYDSMNWYDQHEDMRLDIDDMSYEELLALEDTIGNVSTGLSEEIISRSFEEVTHCLSYQIKDGREERTCVICLEEYKDQDKLGRLSCRHEFHSSCIKNWLLIKNACPVCKAAAFSNLPKEKLA